jgi:hypothetical protein
MTSRSTPLASRSNRQRASRRIAIALFGVSGGLIATPALGEPNAALTLRWQAPAGCPQQAEVKERIRALIGSTRPAATSLLAEGTITQTDSTHFHLKLVTRSGGLVGERTLDASSCANLTGAAAVSVALLLRSTEPLSEGDLAGKPGNGATAPAGATTGGGTPTATGSGTTGNAATGSTATGATTTGSAQAGTAATTATASQSSAAAAGASARKQSAESKKPSQDSEESELPPSEIIERPIRPSSSGRKGRVLVQIPLAVMSLGPLPKPSWGVAFAGGASFESWRLLLGGTAWLRQHVTSEQSPDFGADIDRLTGTFRACRTLGESKFEVAPCLVLSLEHIAASGTGAGVTAHSEQATWLAVGAGAQGRLNLTRHFGVLFGLDAQIETARPVISIDGAGTVKQLGYAAFTATIGPEWIL